MAKADFIETYLQYAPKERIKFIFKYYGPFDQVVKNYKRSLESEIVADIQFSKSHNRDELGVRIQNLGLHSDITSDEALQNLDIDTLIEGGLVSKGFTKLLDDEETILEKIYIYREMRDEYKAVSGLVNEVHPDSRVMFLSYLYKEKNPYDLADEYGMELKSLQQKIWRIKSSIIEQSKCCFEKNNRRIK